MIETGPVRTTSRSAAAPNPGAVPASPRAEEGSRANDDPGAHDDPGANDDPGAHDGHFPPIALAPLAPRDTVRSFAVRSARVPRRSFVVAVLAVALVAGLALPAIAVAWDPNSFSSASESELVALANQSRASAGLSVLRVDSDLTSIARWRSKDMIERDYFSHSIPPGGTSVFDEMQRRGFCFKLAGENIGWNTYPDDQATAAIHEMFMNSSGHRANILGKDWEVIGVGAYKGADGKKMWTVLFADPCTSTATPTPKPTPTPTPKPTPAPTPAPTPTPAPATPAAPVPTPTPAATPSPTAAPSAAPSWTPTPQPTPRATPKPAPSATFEPTPEPSAATQPSPTPKPTSRSAAEPSPTPAPSPEDLAAPASSPAPPVVDDPGGPDRPVSSAGPGRGDGPVGQDGSTGSGQDGSTGSGGDGPSSGASLRILDQPQAPGLLEAILGNVAGFFFGS